MKEIMYLVLADVGTREGIDSKKHLTMRPHIRHILGFAGDLEEWFGPNVKIANENTSLKTALEVVPSKFRVELRSRIELLSSLCRSGLLPISLHETHLSPGMNTHFSQVQLEWLQEASISTLARPTMVHERRTSLNHRSKRHASPGSSSRDSPLNR